MSPIKTATSRLEKAIDRLDKAARKSQEEAGAQDAAKLAERLTKAEAERKGLDTDLIALKSDHKKLSAALREAHENYASTRLVNDTVAGRLDDAIGEIKTLLEG